MAQALLASDTLRPPTTSPRTSARRWPLFLAATAVWAPAINNLRLEWEINEQYRYGFAIPLLCLYLFWLRWNDHPKPTLPRHVRIAQVAATLLLLTFLPLVLIEAANPDWRMIGWALALCATGVALLFLYYVGGKSWVVHFAFPVCFFLIAVPWPSRPELQLMQTMMGLNAAISVDVLNLLAVPAKQLGNVIDLGTATVGVEEACSGLRSLQTSLMAGLLFGEMYRLNWWRRASLVAAAILIACLWNIIRTLILVWLVVAFGSASLEAWHDQIGLAVLVLTIASICGLTWLLRPDDSDDLPEASPLAQSSTAKLTSVTLLRCIPSSWYWTTIAWITFVFVATECWYGSKRSSVKRAPLWTVYWPSNQPGFRQSRISDQTRLLLGHTRGATGSWKDREGRRWSAYHLEWEARRSSQSKAQVHRPDVCMAAAGKSLVDDRGTRIFSSGPIIIPFHHYVFSDGPALLHVFFSLVTFGDSKTNLYRTDGLSMSDRYRAVTERRRNAGQQQLEVGVWGIKDSEEAAEAFAKTLQQLVVAVP